MKKEETTSEQRYPSKIDVVLQRCAWCAQILLFVGAIAGYVLTVRPVYQKQLLDEQIAEKTVLLREVTATLEKLRSEEGKLKNENNRLAKEADVTYTQLRKNLADRLGSVASSCTYGRVDSPLTGQDLLDCVTRYIYDEITPFLRPEDHDSIQLALKAHNKEILNLPLKITKALSVQLKKARDDIATIQASREKNKQDLLNEMRRLRSNNGEQGVNIGTVDEIGLPRNEAETKLYLSSLSEAYELVRSLQNAKINEFRAKADTTTKQHDELIQIMDKISEKLRN